ncbi:MAG: rane protein [Bacteroidetes bacterium]|nr:rane protein [Bacteroidota bacterium]
MSTSLFRSSIGIFRLVAILEGISYLLLLCLAMPLKYIFNYKSAVLYIGWVHGLLFITFVGLLIYVWIKYRWSFGKVMFAFLMSLIPFGTFMLDRKLKKEPH